MRRITTLLFTVLLTAISAVAAPIKITVLPFTNLNGEFDRNIVAYDLQEAINAKLEELDSEGEFELVPLMDVELELSNLNLDPSNPQYESDLWKAVSNLGVKKVLLGSYDYKDGKYLINAYVYDARMKLAHPRFQSKDNFIDEDKVTELAEKIVNDLKGAILKKK